MGWRRQRGASDRNRAGIAGARPSRSLFRIRIAACANTRAGFRLSIARAKPLVCRGRSAARSEGADTSSARVDVSRTFSGHARRAGEGPGGPRGGRLHDAGRPRVGHACRYSRGRAGPLRGCGIGSTSRIAHRSGLVGCLQRNARVGRFRSSTPAPRSLGSVPHPGHHRARAGSGCCCCSRPFGAVRRPHPRAVSAARLGIAMGCHRRATFGARQLQHHGVLGSTRPHSQHARSARRRTGAGLGLSSRGSRV